MIRLFTLYFYQIANIISFLYLSSNIIIGQEFYKCLKAISPWRPGVSVSLCPCVQIIKKHQNNHIWTKMDQKSWCEY